MYQVCETLFPSLSTPIQCWMTAVSIPQGTQKRATKKQWAYARVGRSSIFYCPILIAQFGTINHDI